MTARLTLGTRASPLALAPAGLGLTFRTLQYRLEKFGIKRPDKHGAAAEEEDETG